MGFALGASLTLAIQGWATLPDPASVAEPTVPRTEPEPPQAFLVWTSGGMPDGFRAAVRRLDGIQRSVVIASDNTWLNRSWSEQGEVVDDPRLFGLAWPVFGIAAALSTVAAARHFGHVNRLRVWAVSHLLMAAGVVLPSLWLAPVTIAVAALLVGSTFMVVTMIGMQEARARSPGNPTALLGLMTAAFAVGQLAGPLVSGIIDLLPVGHRAALGCALQLAAFALASSAAYLWRQGNAI